MDNKIRFYGYFERFWHWAQMIVIVTLTVTGFEIHGSFELFGYLEAVRIHDASAWVYIAITLLAMAWMLFSGEWQQFWPSAYKVKEQAQYYLSGIFKHAPHPVEKTPKKKLNPLQRIVYFVLLGIIVPAQILTGLAYMYFQYTKNQLGLNSLKDIAIIHTVGAFLLMAFLVTHLYLITTGKKPSTNLKAMITGFEDEETEENNLKH